MSRRRTHMKPELKPTLARRLALWAVVSALVAGVFSPSTSATPVSSLGPVNLWIGLTNSDDVGIRFDVKVEITHNLLVVGTGQLDSIAGGSSGFNNASLRTFNITPVPGADIVPGIVVGLNIYVRNACVASGKNSGRMRLWYNDGQADSRFEINAGGTVPYYLRTGLLTLQGTPGPGPKATIDTQAGPKCGPWVPLSALFAGLAGHANPDTTPPTLNITAPANGTTTTSASIGVSGTVSDASAVTVTVNGQNAPVSNGAFSTNAALAVGSNTITVVATDASNNQTTQTRTVTRTSPIPTITVTSPASGALVRSPVTVTGTIGGGVAPLTVDVNGTAATMNGSSYTANVPVADGARTLTATVHSASGETAQASVNVVVDSTAPVISVTAPADNQYVSAQTIEVTGGVSDASAVTLTVNGQSTPVTGGAFSATVPVGGGPTEVITLVATDAAGNNSQATRTLNVDRTAPTIAIATPAPNARVQGPLVTVSGTATDASSVIVEVNGELTQAISGAFSISIPAPDGPLAITATARDAAGNTAAANVSVVVDSVAPTVTITSPADGAIVNTATVHITGTVADGSNITLTIGGVAVPLVGGEFAYDADTGANGTHAFLVSATDAAGNTTTREVNVVVDRTAPTLSIAAPEDGAFITTLPLTVSGVASDQTTLTVTVNGVAATRVGEGWDASLTTLTDGPQTLSVVARDAAGNETVVTRSISVDVNAPVLSLTAPASGLLTQAASVVVTGTVLDPTLSGVTVNGVVAALTAQGGGATFTATAPLSEGDNVLTVVASDGTGRSSTVAVTVTRDSIAPTLDITAPARVTLRVPGQATVTASDNLTLAQVAVSVNGAAAGTFTTPPIAVDLPIPDGAAVGDTLTVVAVATDTAGNATSATRVVRITGDGAVVGQVLSDTTGLPVPGAVVKLGAEEAQSDARGQYTFPTAGASALVEVSLAGAVPVERAVVVQPEVGTVMVDARLTLLAAPVAVPASGGTLTGGALTLVVPSSAVAGGAAVRLTPMSPQGLPGLLPLGWSPLGAADVRADSAALGAGMTLRATLPAALATGPAALTSVALAQYDTTLHAWTLAAADVPVTAGAVEAEISGAGAFAFVVADVLDPALPPAAVGAALPAASMMAIPVTATSAGTVSPAILSPGGGTATGMLAVQSPLALPSGTLVQADVTETFTLTGGDVASDEKRRQDVILYRVPAPDATALPDGFVPDVSATFPITPSRTFAPAALTQGTVHLDILAGRESVRGQVGGGLATTVMSGGAQVTVAGGAAPADTVIAIQPTVLSTFVPTATGVEALGELVLDLGGLTLGSPATLSIAAPGLSVAPTDTLLVARVERFDGVPSFVVVSTAAFQNDRVGTVASSGLPGITVGGRYVFYRVALPLGWAQATATANGAAAAGAVIATPSLPFAGVASSAGQARVPAVAGAVTLSARVPRTALAGAASANIVAGATTSVAIALEGTTTTAVVTPANGASGVAVTAQVEIQSNVPLQALTVTSTNVRLLLDSDGTVVPSQLLVSSSGQTLSVIPTARLAAATRYRLEASGLADTTGGLVIVPATAFTTAADTELIVDPTKLSFAMPENGQSAVTAPAGTFAPGTTVLVVNTGNGAVLSFTAQNDGSLSGSMTASTVDRLLITITDPIGRTTSLQRSSFVAADGTTAVGAGGGVVTGTGGMELRVPEGAIDTAATFKIEAEDYAATFPNQAGPDLPGATLASAMKITTDTLRFDKEIDLVFPRPADAPEGAFFYIYRRLEGPNGELAFETLDHGLVEGTGANAKVVTASDPFAGFIGSYTGFDPSGGLQSLGTMHAIMMWTINQFLPGSPEPGVVSGRVLRARIVKDGTTEYDPIPDAIVLRAEGTTGGVSTVAVSQPKTGKFTLWDAQYTGGTVSIQTKVGGVTQVATAYEANPQDSQSLGLALGRYQHVATANFVFPPLEPAPPTPAITIKVVKESETGTTRADTGGIVTVGEPLVIGFTTPDTPGNSATFLPATVNGVSKGVRSDTFTGTPAALRFQSVLSDFFTPTVPGTYTIVAQATPAFGAIVTATASFRAVAAGGSVTTSVPGAPPAVIDGRSVPRANATEVSPEATVSIVFTEPVRNIPGNVVLADVGLGIHVPITIAGAGLSGPIARVAAATDVVTGLTIQPVGALRVGAVYQLQVGGTIEDLDSTPISPQYRLDFTTFNPEAVGEFSDIEGAGGLVIVGTHAYVARSTLALNTSIYDYDISDPGNVTRKAIGADRFIGAPSHLSVDAHSTLAELKNDDSGTGGPVLALSTMRTTTLLGPSNVHLVDVSAGAPKWIGAISLGLDPLDGIVKATVLRGERLYALTAGMGKGLQIVDAGLMVSRLNEARANSVAQYTADLDLSVPGRGFHEEDVEQVVFIDTGMGQNSQQADMAVANFTVEGTSVPVAVTTGRRALAIVNTQTGTVLYNGSVQDAAGTDVLTVGLKLALGTVTDAGGASRSVAVVLGVGDGGWQLVVVDLSDVERPRLMGRLTLPTSAFDGRGSLLVHDGVVLIGGLRATTQVSITTPEAPRVMGTIQGLGGQLALSADGTVLTSAGHFYTSESETKGIHAAVLDRVVRLVDGSALSKLSTPNSPVGTGTRATVEPMKLRVRVYPTKTAVAPGSAAVELRAEAAQNPAMGRYGLVSEGDGFFGSTIAKGWTYPERKVVTGVPEVTTPEGEKIIGPPEALKLGEVTLIVDANNDTKLDGDSDVPADRDKDEAAMRQGKVWAFWEADRNEPSVQLTADQTPSADGLTDFARIRLRVTGEVRELRFGLVEHADEVGSLRWSITPLRGKQTEYLTSATVALQQRVEAGRLCEEGGAVLQGRCVWFANLSHVLPGVYDWLLRCENCPQHQDPRNLVVELVSETESNEELDAAATDIRPITGWMSVKRARTSKNSEDVRANDLESLLTWAPDTLAGALRSDSDPVVTVLVHGFNVGEDDALSGTFPTLFKRLYWAGHPVHARQGAHTVGIAWPGGTSPNAFAFPVQEYNGFHTGALLAKYLSQVKAEANRPKLRIVAHSLGNLVANTAVRYADGLDPTDSLAMVDAAVAREAFVSSEEALSPDLRDEPLVSGGAVGVNVSQLGFPEDRQWEARWDDPTLGPVIRNAWPGAFRTQGISDERLRRLFTYRWRRVAQPTPWRGIFAANRTRVRMFNVYNTNDQALASDSNALWWHGQVLEKPFNLFLDSFWANFNGIGTDDKLSPDDERQWIEDAFETGDPLSATDHSAATIARRHRRWTELSFFFRALSRPAGLGPVDGLDTENSKRNFPVTDLAGSGGLTLPGTGAPQYPSHTFLTTAPLTEMWPLYKFLAETALK